MALSASEQELLEWALASLPPWFTSDERSIEYLGGVAKMLGSVKDQVDYWFGQALITNAVGSTATTPDWLNLHAADRGTARTPGESDATLRDRLRNYPDAVTVPALEDIANAILNDGGYPQTAAIVELRAHKAFMGDRTVDSGTGGTISGTAPNMEFTPTVAFARGVTASTPEDRDRRGVKLERSTITLAGSTTPANDGTFTVTGINGNAVQYTNASGVAEAHPGTWTNTSQDDDGNDRDGRASHYFSRGYRMGKGGLIVILPYDTDAATATTVAEALRQRRAAGFLLIVERRLNP